MSAKDAIRPSPARPEMSPALAAGIGSVFVTGTDTGVGKTFVGCVLVAWAASRGLRVAAMKPVETGCAVGPGGVLQPDDALRLRAVAGADAPLDLVCPYRFRPPVSPSVAAREAGVAIEIGRIVAAAGRLRAGADFFLAEGAGGLLVPLGGGKSMADLALALGLPLLLVARASLGTINHTLLTLSEARRRGLAVVGVILDRTTAAAGPDDTTNAAEIAREGGVPVLGTLPHAPGLTDPADLTRLAARHLDLRVFGASAGPLQ